MSEISKMNCPACGAPMNHHSDKLVYGTSQPDSSEVPDDGGVVLEFHCCPGCGRSTTRNI